MPPIKLSLNKVTDIKLQHGYNDNEIHIHYSSSLFNTSPDMDITATAQTDRETDESSTCLSTGGDVWKSQGSIFSCWLYTMSSRETADIKMY